MLSVLLRELRLVTEHAYQSWTREVEGFETLQMHVHCGQPKLQKVFRLFDKWVHENKLESMLAEYRTNSVKGTRELQILTIDDSKLDQYFRTRYRRADLVAVIAHIRHLHTNYDSLLMSGVERSQARESIRHDVQRVLRDWS